MLNCHNNLLVLVGARWFTRLSRLPLNSLLSARPSSATRGFWFCTENIH